MFNECVFEHSKKLSSRKLIKFKLKQISTNGKVLIFTDWRFEDWTEEWTGSVTVRGYDDDYYGDDANAFTIYSHTSSYRSVHEHHLI